MFRCCAFATILFIAAQSDSASAAEPTPIDISGCWSGYWMSCADGHSGPMQATICKIGDNCYSARFKGKFFVVIPFRYSTRFRVVGREGDALLLAGEERLGPVLGTYRFNATVTATDFDASYSARIDNGKFVMKRVGQ